MMWQCVGGMWYWFGDVSDVFYEKFVVAVV